MLTIVLRFNDNVLKTIETDKGVITIGRSAASDVHIDNLSVSKQHAKILKAQDQYILEDLKSTNGTYLNEKSITRAELNEGDIITIGKHTLEIHVNSTVAPGGKSIVNDTMLLKTEKHKKMLKKQGKS